MAGLRPFRTIPTNLREWTQWMQAQDIPDAASLAGDDAITSFVANVFQRSGSAPATPTENSASYNFTTGILTPPVGWFENAPASDGNPLYVSTATFSIVGVTGVDSTATWSTPALVVQDGDVGEDGTASLVAGRQANNLVVWWGDSGQVGAASPHITTAVTGPVWSDVIQITDNDDTLEDIFSNRSSIDRTRRHRVNVWARQTTGDRRNYLLVVFYNSAGNVIAGSGADVVGWTGGGTYHYWQIVNAVFPGTFTNYQFEFGGRATPVIPASAVALAIGTLGPGTGASGTNTIVQFQDYYVIEAAQDGIEQFLTNPAHTLAANFDGTGYDLVTPASGGTHTVLDEGTDVTTTAVHSVTGGSVKNGLTASVVSGTGVYSFTGGSWTSISETFTFRAVYKGVNYDSVYTITKAAQGSDGGCAIDTVTSITLIDSGVGGTRTVGFRVDNDGDIFERANNGASYVSKETWIGACANSAYEAQLTKSSGTDPSSGPALITWWVISTDSQWQWTQAPTGNKAFSGTLKIRRTSDNAVLASVSVSITLDSDV